jgi:hypothetical protein
MMKIILPMFSQQYYLHDVSSRWGKETQLDNRTCEPSSLANLDYYYTGVGVAANEYCSMGLFIRETICSVTMKRNLTHDKKLLIDLCEGMKKERADVTVSEVQSGFNKRYGNGEILGNNSLSACCFLVEKVRVDKSWEVVSLLEILMS